MSSLRKTNIETAFTLKKHENCYGVSVQDRPILYLANETPVVYRAKIYIPDQKVAFSHSKSTTMIFQDVDFIPKGEGAEIDKGEFLWTSNQGFFKLGKTPHGYLVEYVNEAEKYRRHIGYIDLFYEGAISIHIANPLSEQGGSLLYYRIKLE